MCRWFDSAPGHQICMRPSALTGSGAFCFDAPVLFAERVGAAPSSGPSGSGVMQIDSACHGGMGSAASHATLTATPAPSVAVDLVNRVPRRRCLHCHHCAIPEPLLLCLRRHPKVAMGRWHLHRDPKDCRCPECAVGRRWAGRREPHRTGHKKFSHEVVDCKVKTIYSLIHRGFDRPRFPPIDLFTRIERERSSHPHQQPTRTGPGARARRLVFCPAQAAVPGCAFVCA